MNNGIHRLKNSIAFYGLFFPIKKNGLLFFVVFGAIVYLVRGQFYNEESSYSAFLELFLWIGGIFSVLVIGTGLLYTLICWGYLIFNRESIEMTLHVGLDDGVKGTVGEVPIEVSVSKVLMPLIGYLKLRLLFEDGSMSPPIVLSNFTRGWKDLLPKNGRSVIHFTDRTQYRVWGYVMSCEDYLEFFKLSFSFSLNKTFYLHSPEVDLPVDDIKPSTTKEMIDRVKTSKKVEGDYLNYKDFESGDDVRRIVWKIFAKNKELVVRVPEVINPYASHIYFFSSFYNELESNAGNKYIKGVLNFYKDMVFNLCLSLEKSGKQIKFNLDQPVHNGINVEPKDLTAYKLSNARWQSELPVTDIKVPPSEALICVSSLVPASQIEELMNKNTASFFIVKVSKYLNNQYLFNFKNLFLYQERQNEISKVGWLMSSLRRKIRRNEEEIDQLVSRVNFKGQVL